MIVAPLKHARILVLASIAAVAVSWACFLAITKNTEQGPKAKPIAYEPRTPLETSGYLAVYDHMAPFGPNATLEDYATDCRRNITRSLAMMDKMLERGAPEFHKVLMTKAVLLHSEGKATEAYEVLKDLESRVRDTELEAKFLYTIIYYEGVTALRMGENDNCVMCRGESSCIFPIARSAIHRNPSGSRRAIKHFDDYLKLFPDDLEVKWLLNVAHMTIGEQQPWTNPHHRIELGSFNYPEFDIGVFRDVSDRVGLSRFNQSGGAIMDDFDNDGLLDIVVTDWAPYAPMAFYRNRGDGTFEDRTSAAGLARQMGGLYCVQTDYNNDGHLDIFIPRGAWMRPHLAMRPSLLRNNGNATFTDVTAQAGLTKPYCSNSASWADYDNDGNLDVFLCGNQMRCPLYRNKGDGTFEEVGLQAGLSADLEACLGAAWIDYDNDRYPDLFINMGNGYQGPPGGTARLYHNNRNGTFTNVTREMGIDGPQKGFSCWAFDFDNDGWIDIFASTIDHSLEGVVKGLLDQPHKRATARLYRNVKGKRFQDLSREAGLDRVYSPMGSNFGDLDNDGYLDFYLATGDPSLDMLVPNRFFKNVAGKRFADITTSTRTGHLQKGHGVAIGDWDRNGTADLFVQLGGAVRGDQFHIALFQNPGQGNNWLNVKLVGKKTNRAAIGARIKVTTPGDHPQTITRHISSGSSFGANPLEQHLGLGKAKSVARLEVYWPTSNTTQVFDNISANQGIVITEFEKGYQKRSWNAIRLPE